MRKKEQILGTLTSKLKSPPILLSVFSIFSAALGSLLYNKGMNLFSGSGNGLSSCLFFMLFTGFLKKKITRKEKPQEESSNKDEPLSHKILEKISTNIYIYNVLDKKVVYINPACSRSIGYSIEELRGMDLQEILSLIHPDDISNLMRHQEKIRKEKDHPLENIELRVMDKTGSWIWLNLQESVFSRDEQDEVKEIIGTAINITGKKIREAELIESRHFINSIIDTSPNDIYVIDLVNNKSIFFSLNTLRSLGYSPEQLIEMGDQLLPILIHPDDLPVLKANDQKIMKQKTDDSLRTEVRIQHSNGEWHWFWINNRPFKRNEKGEVTHIVGVSMDITESKKAEIKLKESQHIIEKILKVNPNFIFVHDIVNHTNLFHNKKLMKMLGYRSEDIQAMGDKILEKITHPEDFPRLLDVLNKSKDLKENQVESIVVRGMHASGEIRWVDVRWTPFKRNEAGEVIQVSGVATNITDLKNTELELEESRNFILKITETIPNLIYIYDLNLKKPIYVNKTVETILGYLPEEYLSFTLDDFFKLTHPEDHQKLKEHFEKVFVAENDDKWVTEYRILDKKGLWKWVLVVDTPFKRNEKGEIIQTIGVTVDVTEDKISEEKLEEHKRYIQKINEAVPNPIYILEIETLKIVNINNAVKDLLGYTQNEIYEMGGKLIENLIHPEDQAAVFRHVEIIKESKDDIGQNLEVRIKDVNGNWHWFILRNKIFQKDKHGNPTHLIGNASDITVSKKMESEIINLNRTLEAKVTNRTAQLQESEENLRESKKLLMLITNSVPALISYVDSNCAYKFTNSYYQKITGIKGDGKGKKVKDLIGESNFGKVKDVLSKALAGKEFSIDTEFKLVDGSHKIFRINYIPDLDREGRPKGCVVMGIDLTDQARYEKNLEEKNNELKRINTDLDNFIYTASHDLKSPIANMEALLTGLMENADNGCKDEEMVILLNMLGSSIQRLKTTILELTEISRAQKDLNEAEEDLEIKSFIEEFMTEYSKQLTETQTTITTDLQVNHIRFARKNFRSILHNLLSNALKYRSPERKLRVRIKTYSVNGRIILSVADNGIGFDIRKKDRIFGMFKRLHAHVEGTGVGLYIVKRIIENAGGKIDVDSTEGVGSEFKVEFKTQTLS